MLEQENIKPLAGLRVIDFTRILAGPFCTALLGDLGAEIIKVEPPAGDDYRNVAPIKKGEGALFTVMNRNKKSLVLDLKKEEAVALVHELVATADIVVENFRPGVTERLGVDYERLQQINPRLIYVSVSGFGQSGPYSRRPAYDIVLQAMTGLMEATGSPDGPPTLVGEAISDVVSGLFASWGALVALYAREKNGKGTHVDVSMFNATLAFAATSVSRYLFTGQAPQRVGNRHPLSAPFGVFEAADGHFVIAVLNHRQFEQLAQAIEQPEIAQWEKFATDDLRNQNEAELRQIIERWSKSKTAEEAIEALGAASVPAAPIWDIEQALNSEQATETGFLTHVRHEKLDDLKLPSQPVSFSGFAANTVGPAPALGEHNEEVLGQVLGLAQSRITELSKLGVFG